MILPKDPLLLMSVVNTRLRDLYPDLDSLCDDLGEDRREIESKLSAAGYSYDGQRNQFIKDA
ncbi:MAG: DUF4250 domain-containing protein [Clostridiales bacterium]|nr:DUF4250 domain-containing protein [Clostridiales bacterium]